MKMKKVTSTFTRRQFGSSDHQQGLSLGMGGGKVVKYTPCSRHDISNNDDDLLEEIAVVSNVPDPGSVKYGPASYAPIAGQPGSVVTVNGPRVVPGIITSGYGGASAASSGPTAASRLTDSGTQINTSSPIYMTKGSSDIKSKSMSKQSLLDLVTSKISGTDKRRLSRESIAFINRAHIGSDADVSAQHRHPDTSGRGRRIKVRELNDWDAMLYNQQKSGCRLTFLFDPSGRFCYYWSMMVSIAFLYNFWVMIYRFSFNEINGDSLLTWFLLDYLADLFYLVDIAFHFRTGYLEDGVLQTDPIKLRQYYLNSTTFYIDCLCLLPLDFLYLSIGYNSLLRCFRLIKIYRFWACLDRTERHTNYPNVVRAMSLTHYILVIFHWNACLYQIVARFSGFESNKFVAVPMAVSTFLFLTHQCVRLRYWWTWQHSYALLSQ